MPKAKDDELRGRLIDGAGRVFAAVGFAGASMAGIGAQVGVTKGGVYFHFRTKEELFFAVVEHWREAHRSRLAGGGGADPTLREFLADYLRFHFEHPEAFGLLRVLASEMKGRFTTQIREDHQATLRAVRARIRELLMQGIHDGRLFATDPALATFVLAATVEGVLSLVSSTPRDAEPFRHPESIVDFVLSPYETADGDSGEDRPVGGAEPEGQDLLPPLRPPLRQAPGSFGGSDPS
jgi:AcrR family transcriptional regulator